MPKCEFTFPRRGNVEEQKKKLTSELEKMNGSVEFTDERANFNINIGMMITIVGNIFFNEENIVIHIEEKPAFINCEMIKSEIDKIFNKM